MGNGMKRMALSDTEAEVIRGMRIERNIYNQAIADCLAIIHAHEWAPGSAGLIIDAILKLRKE
jgi:hypothetical protein